MPSLRRFLLAVAILLGGASAAHAIASSRGLLAEADPDAPALRIVAGTIRNEGAGWFALDDANHTPIGVTVRGVYNGGLVVDYPTSCTIAALLVTPDEHLAQAGIFAGASVARGSATIWLSQATPTGAKRLSPLNPVLQGTTSNLWLLGVFEGTGCPLDATRRKGGGRAGD